MEDERERTAVDYGAAHSMDTSWFAVDAAGHVARFDSGEDGAVPTNAASRDADEHDFFRFDAALVARVLAKLAEADWPRAPEDPARAKIAQRLLFVVRGAGTAYRDEAPASVESKIAPEPLEVVRARAPRVLVTTRPFAPAERRALETHPEVVRVWDERSLHDVLDAADEGAAGLFVYGHSFEDETAGQGTYARECAPAAPLAIDELPEAEAAELARVKLPIRFGESVSVELADHFRDDEVDKWVDAPLRLPAEGTPEREAYEASERRKAEAREHARFVRSSRAWRLAFVAIVGALLYFFFFRRGRP